MKGQTLILRFLLYLGGFVVFSFGTALSIKSTLGVTATTSLPLALGAATGTSVGVMMIVMAVAYVLGQLLLLGKAFPPASVGQVGAGLLMGFLVDWMTRSLEFYAPESYPEKLLLTVVALPVIALGLSMIINANFLPTPSEGFSLTLARKLGKDFSKVKVAVDCVTLLAAVLVSLVFSRSISGIREGTVINAVSIGFLIGLFNRLLKPFYLYMNGKRTVRNRRSKAAPWRVGVAVTGRDPSDA